MELQPQETTIEIGTAKNQDTIVVGTDDQEVQSVILVKRSDFCHHIHSGSSRRLVEERDPSIDRTGRSYSTRRGRDSTLDEVQCSSSRSLETSTQYRLSASSPYVIHHTISSKNNNTSKGRPSRPTMIRKESNISMASQSSSSSLANRLRASLSGKKKPQRNFQRANSGSSVGRPVAFFEY